MEKCIMVKRLNKAPFKLYYVLVILKTTKIELLSFIFVFFYENTKKIVEAYTTTLNYYLRYDL